MCLLALALAGCGGSSPCARSTECRRGSVCSLEGHCARLRPPAGARFAGSRWLEPVDWGIAGADGPLDDAMSVGGTSEALLAFAPLPEPSRILRALLVVHPHERRPRVRAATEVVVERVGTFHGGALPARHGVQPTPFAAAHRLVAVGPARPLRFDVTGAARSAVAGRLQLLLRLEGDAPALELASPWAAEERIRPRLELMVR